MILKLRITQKALILNKGKFLILKKSSDPSMDYASRWELPGGGLEIENPIKGIKREVREEVNLDIKNLEPIHTCSEEIKGNYKAIIIWKCDLKSGSIKLSEEHSEFRWVKKKDLKNLKMYPHLKDLLQKKKL